MKLILHPDEYVIASLPYGSLKPREGEGFSAVIATTDGTTIVCRKHQEPLSATVEGGWRWVEVPGPFGFSEVGILRAILDPLQISIFAISSFSKDHLFVKQSDIESAMAAWISSGFEVVIATGG
jgi:hypothetical protein